MELVNQLVDQLGVTPDQARAGAGVLLGAAEKRLPPEEFRQISRLIPGLDEMLKAGAASGQPKAGAGLAGILLAIASRLGLMSKDKAAIIGRLVAIAAIFKKLGLKKEHVVKFVQVIRSYLSSKDGSLAADILGKILAGK